MPLKTSVELILLDVGSSPIVTPFTAEISLQVSRSSSSVGELWYSTCGWLYGTIERETCMICAECLVCTILCVVAFRCRKAGVKRKSEHGESSGGCEGCSTGVAGAAPLKRQAETIKKYFLPDVEFFYLYFNTKGIQEMIVTYQVAQILANYQGAEFRQISYDETANIVNLWVHVRSRPWPLYWNGNIPLSVFTVLEFQDVEQDKGKRHARTVKMIKSQRDWFEFSPFIRVIPIVADLYANYQLRLLLGNIVTDTVTMGLKLLEFLLPAPLAKPIFG